MLIFTIFLSISRIYFLKAKLKQLWFIRVTWVWVFIADHLYLINDFIFFLYLYLITIVREGAAEWAALGWVACVWGHASVMVAIQQDVCGFGWTVLV